MTKNREARRLSLVSLSGGGSRMNRPAHFKELYYLADKHGVTHYSKTYAEHLRKKRLYLGT